MGSRPLEDQELVERARNGDLSAYDVLVRRYREVAVRAAYVVGGGADAEDAVQDAFVKAFAALDRFRPGAAFRPWILRIVTNEARNRRRSAGRRAALALRASEQRIAADAAPSAETAALAEEERRALLAAVNRLGDGDREVVGYRYFLGLSEEEMAAALGRPRGTVKSRLSRAMARLREELGADG